MSLTTLHKTFWDNITASSTRTNAILKSLDHMVWLILGLLIVGIFVLIPQVFRNVTSLQIILHGSVALGFLVLAESLCLLSGHFDLSIGSIAGFSAIFTAMAFSGSHWGVISHPVVGVLLILTIGTIIGTLNGLSVAKLGVNPFLQTLAFLIIFRGAMLTLTTSPIYQLPAAYFAIGNTPAIAIGLLIFSYLAFAYILRYTSFGMGVYALGSNEKSARSVGINTDRLVILVYAVSGFLAAIAGLILSGYAQSVSVNTGDGMVFPAFAAAVIGGISLFGGRGKITGALGGVLLLGLVQSALNISGVGASEVQMINGLVLLFAILLYNSKSKLREKVLQGSV